MQGYGIMFKLDASSVESRRLDGLSMPARTSHETTTRLPVHEQQGGLRRPCEESAGRPEGHLGVEDDSTMTPPENTATEEAEEVRASAELDPPAVVSAQMSRTSSRGSSVSADRFADGWGLDEDEEERRGGGKKRNLSKRERVALREGGWEAVEEMRNAPSASAPPAANGGRPVSAAQVGGQGGGSKSKVRGKKGQMKRRNRCAVFTGV